MIKFKNKKTFSVAVLAWYSEFGRKGLPWQKKDAYTVWISEIMLQQTQVKTVLQKFEAWIKRFPTIRELASASQEQVLKMWEGLGYYARARNIHKAAIMISETFEVGFPEKRADRLLLPGVGPSTASAIGSLAFGLREPIMDANVLRVWSRLLHMEVPTQKKELERWWFLATEVMPHEKLAIKEYGQAMMDIGALVCLPRTPKCTECPIKHYCKSTASVKPVKKVKEKTLKKTEYWDFLLPDISENDLFPIQQFSGNRWGGLYGFPSVCSEKQIKWPTPQEVLAAGEHELSHRHIVWRILPIDFRDILVYKDVLTLHSLPIPKWGEVFFVTKEGLSKKALPIFLRSWLNEKGIK